MKQFVVVFMLQALERSRTNELYAFLLKGLERLELLKNIEELMTNRKVRG